MSDILSEMQDIQQHPAPTQQQYHLPEDLPKMPDETILQVITNLAVQFGKNSLLHRALNRQLQQLSAEMDQQEGMNHILVSEATRRGLQV